jgi:iron complex outermembrane recepter protein
MNFKIKIRLDNYILRNTSMKFAFIMISMFLFLSPAKAQTLKGRLVDSLQAPVPYISVALLKAKDSSIIKGTNTDGRGDFIFRELNKDSLLIKVVGVGFEEIFPAIYVVDSLSDLNAGTLVLHPAAYNLNEVSVTVMKKLIEFKHGNIIVNVENSPLAVGNSLYDLLSRLPTVSVINDDISIQGKGGARILMDERILQMSGQQLITVLKGIRASSIEKIEILKNPPVKYDAEGVGFISVKTKKLKISGFSGSVNIDYQQGFYANKDAGLLLNYKGKSFAVFSGISCGNDESLFTLLFSKNVTNDGVTINFNELTKEKQSNLFASYIFGADWYLNNKNTLGFRIEGSDGRSMPDLKGVNSLNTDILGYREMIFTSFRPNAWNYVNYNLNSEHQFDTLGTKLRFSFDYSPNLDLNSGDYENYFYDSLGNTAFPPLLFKSDNNLRFIIYTARLDFEKQLNKTLKLETGLKGNDQNMTTNFAFSNKELLTGEYVIDTAFTNGFTYKEHIYAGYINFLKEYKTISFQIGCRAENTAIRASSETGSITYKRDYFNLFPMLSIDYNPSEEHSFQLAYNRRIDRPDYTSFNPYRQFTNLFTSTRGNPYLLPEYYHNIEFTHGFQGGLYNTIGFSVVDNLFYQYQIQNDNTGETVITESNLDKRYNYDYSLFLSTDVTDWWELNFESSVRYATFSGTVNGKSYWGDAFPYLFSTENQFSFPKSFKVELSGRYFGATKEVLSNDKSRWAVDVAIQKNFLNDKLNITIGMNDIFYTWISATNAQYLNVNSTFKTTEDTRRFKIGISYNFGKVKVEQREIIKNEEEKRLDH